LRLGWNLIAGLANSFWFAIATLAAVPFFLRYLGIEAYGLIGFFVAIQALLALLDLGLAPTMNREVARSAACDRSEARDLLHTLAVLFWLVAGLIATSSLLVAPVIAGSWLTASKLSPGTVAQAVAMMGLVIAFRFPSGLYQGALLGAQRMIALSVIEIATTALATVGGVVVVALISPTVQAYFLWQACVGLLNVIAMRAAAWDALRDQTQSRKAKFDSVGLRRIWRFSAGMALTAVLGAVFVQSDKLILSKVVSLTALGRYTLAGMAARSLYLFVTPAFGAVYPRLTALVASGQTDALKSLYRSGSRLLGAVVFPTAAYVAVFSADLFKLWTGDAQLANSISPVVSLLLVGTAINAIMHFPYALQLAYGKSSLAAMISLILLIVFVPLVFVLALSFGILGGAVAWAVLNLLYLPLGVWLTHRTLLRGSGLAWLVGDVGLPLIVAIVVVCVGGYGLKSFDPDLLSRLVLGAALIGASFLAVVGLTPTLSGEVRRFFSTKPLPLLDSR
jgi:O-antigen/teichoic acid export membrane protein